MKLLRPILNMNVIKSAATHRDKYDGLIDHIARTTDYRINISFFHLQHDDRRRETTERSMDRRIDMIQLMLQYLGLCINRLPTEVVGFHQRHEAPGEGSEASHIFRTGDGGSERSTSVAAKRLVDPSADRNKEPILSVLRQYILSGGDQNLLEISSGTGQHLAHFAPYFPQVTFHPSEFDVHLLESITAYSKDFSNVESPIQIDVSTDCASWSGRTSSEKSFDYILNCNMMHISPIACSIGLFKNAGKLLKHNGILFTYGPYMFDGIISPESNVSFNKFLKSRNPEWGLRDVRDLEKLATENGIRMIEIVDMPANNKILIWQKN